MKADVGHGSRPFSAVELYAFRCVGIAVRPERSANGTVSVVFVAVALVTVGGVGFVMLSSSSSNSSQGTYEVAFRQVGAWRDSDLNGFESKVLAVV